MVTQEHHNVKVMKKKNVKVVQFLGACIIKQVLKLVPCDVIENNILRPPSGRKWKQTYFS